MAYTLEEWMADMQRIGASRDLPADAHTKREWGKLLGVNDAKAERIIRNGVECGAVEYVGYKAVPNVTGRPHTRPAYVMKQAPITA